MIKINFEHAPAKISEKKFSKIMEKFKSRGQEFFEILDESTADFHSFAAKFSGKYDEILVLGIGGSALGTRLLADFFGNKKLHVLDTLDPDEVSKFPKSPNTLVVVISKSGGTLETMKLRDHFVEKMPIDRFVVISEKNSNLWNWAAEKKIPAFEMPRNVGGRFSVLTSVGLLPAAVAGIEIDEILVGAKKMRDEFLRENGLPWQLARTIFESGKSQLVHFPYISKLKTFGAWWTQLVGESLGKNGNGFTPIPAVGPTDQHSLLQLLADGPDDFFTIFVENLEFEKNPLGKIANAELRATAESLAEKNRPSATIKIEKCDAETLGELIALWQGTVALLGELLEVNAFDQPGVERGKVLTKKFLGKL
ncbi:hypothetical protein HN954_00695 [bacterium]|jgi:glucose-6-phosphate isomerase|nr:hypothetical protein [bacterium]MBT6832387.1 hypothetical protein [bacterium]MBT6995932.1 hypothetical protein [bacterium]MBT7772793.1 hypothetical protein [bacterium]